MTKKIFVVACVAVALCFALTAVSYAAEKTNVSKKVRDAGQKAFNYPANVVKESVKVVTDTGTRGTDVVTKEVKTTGKVVTGDVAKSKELVTEPITGTADTAVKAVEGTVKVPVEAAKEEPVTTEKK